MAPPSSPVPLSQTRHAELCRAIDSLSKGEMQRLISLADELAYGTAASGRDIFHEVLRLMLAGERCAWSTDTFVRDLYRIVRSVASHWRDAVRQRQRRELDFDCVRVEARGHEEHLDTIGRVQRLRDFFDEQGDVEAVLVIDGMAQGMSMRDAAESLGLSDKQYDAVRKRIRRK